MITASKDDITYLQVEGDIPVTLAEGTFISLDRRPPLKIHAVGFQPARSIPEISRWFLRKYARLPFTVLEPFAGAGTTVVESLDFGAKVYWLDYHPLSRLICRVKTTRFRAAIILQQAVEMIARAAAQVRAPDTVNFANKDFWFQKPVQEGLEILRQHIGAADMGMQPVLWLAFAATVRKTSDMNDGMLLAARRASVEEIPRRARSDVYGYFKLYTEKILEALVQWNEVVSASSLANASELDADDARDLQGAWSCDAIVTSPPYINAIDYVWAAKFELHWLGMIQSDEERLALYAKEIGTERLPRSEWREIGRTGNRQLDHLIEDIYHGTKYQATKDQNALRARVVYQYFVDMRKHFVSSLTHLRPGGYYCFSIGDVSRICGVEIPVAPILTAIACEVGFREHFGFHLLLKNRRLNIPRNVDWAGTIKHDTVVVLQKPL